jgi:hypothetical protein
MKKLSLVFYFFTLVSFGINAQTNPSIKEIEGNWNLFVINIPGKMYYNSATDSLSMDMKAMGRGNQKDTDENSKQMMLDIMKLTMKKEFEKMNFKFDAAGVMYENNPQTDSILIMGTYDPISGKINLKDPKEGEDGKLSIQFNNGVLTLFKEDDGITVTMMCQRKKD